MQYFPVYIQLFFLMMITLFRATHPFVYSAAAEYMYVAGPMLACHNALINYSGANPGANGTVPASVVDAYLPPGLTDPGNFTYVVTAPGIVDTYITNSALYPDPAAIITLVQALSSGQIFAGYVSNGQILTSSNMPTTAAATIVPNGAYVIQTTLRSN